MVGSAAPFQVTTVLALKPEPKTESMNDDAPEVIEFGVMKSRDSEDDVMMKDAMFEAPDWKTCTFAVPAVVKSGAGTLQTISVLLYMPTDNSVGVPLNVQMTLGGGVIVKFPLTCITNAGLPIGAVLGTRLLIVCAAPWGADSDRRAARIAGISRDRRIKTQPHHACQVFCRGSKTIYRSTSHGMKSEPHL